MVLAMWLISAVTLGNHFSSLGLRFCICNEFWPHGLHHFWPSSSPLLTDILLLHFCLLSVLGVNPATSKFAAG